MDPDTAAWGYIKPFRHASQPLSKADTVFPLAQNLKYPPRRRKQQNTDQQQAVGDIHEGTYILCVAHRVVKTLSGRDNQLVTVPRKITAFLLVAALMVWADIKPVPMPSAS